jgi:DNA anti-recombination protein RmuC
MATMGSIDQGIRDISDRLSYLSDNLPRQARWQAEYLMENTVSGQKLEETLNNVNTLVKSVDRMARVVEQSPELIEKERTAVFAEIREERKAVLKSINEQRIETIQEVNKEITEVIKAIHEERIATVKDLRNERIETLEFISKRMEGLVESLFWRVSLCLAGLVAVGLACGAGLLWMKARSNRTPPTAT